MATLKLKITVDELTNVMLAPPDGPGFDEIKVYRSTTGISGVYSELTGPGDRITLVVGTTLYEYIDTDGDVDYWYRYSFYNSGLTTESSQSSPMKGGGGSGLYCTLTDIRDEGFNDPPYSDSRVTNKITEASIMIDKICGRWFEPRTMTFRVRSKGGQQVILPAPIIRIDSVSVVRGLADDDYDESVVDIDSVIVYNRHLTMGMEDPDDRDVPRISFDKNSRFWRGESVGSTWPKFPNGYQAIKVTGVFGYTELQRGSVPGETVDGSQIPLSQGITPPLIEEACKLLTIRNLPLLSDSETRADMRDKWRVTLEKTDVQQISRAAPHLLGIQGTFTGDPEIDEKLAMYVAPPEMVLV